MRSVAPAPADAKRRDHGSPSRQGCAAPLEIANRALALGARRGRPPPDALLALSPKVGNRALARLATGRGDLLQRAVCDRPGTIRHGPGQGRETSSTTLGPSITTLIGDKMWELYNFDIDKPFAKVEHEAYIRDVVVPALKKLIEDHGAYVLVAGEASSTASFTHNWKLSRNRARCIEDILKRELLAAGVIDTSKVLPPIPLGEIFANLRSGDEHENPDDRRVTIMAVERDPREVCPRGLRTRASQRFKLKVACHSPRSASVNIGDVSDPKRPTWRPFKWIASPGARGDCEFRASTSSSAAYGARRDFHLALRDPDHPGSPSDLQGEADLNVGLGWLFAAGGSFSVKLRGAWTPTDCKDRGGELPGVLVPVGPVYCGDVPQPARAKACDDTTKDECTDAEKLAPAKKFGALMERIGFDLPIGRLTKKLPPVARHLLASVTPEMGIALVTIGTMEGPEPRRNRSFLFVGISGDASGLHGQIGVEKEATSSEPLRLATDDPDAYFGASDFDSDLVSWPPTLPDPAKLVIQGGNSNIEELHVGGMTFTFSGAACNSGGSRTIRGWFGGVTPVYCWDLGPLVDFEPTRDCEADDCPEDRQLGSHTEFTFKVGRASLHSLPIGGKRLADRFGCEVVAAFVNVGSQGDDPIYREFLYIGRRKGCRYDVDKRTWTEHFVLDRQLSLADPEDPIDLSDFAGVATLKADGELSVTPLAFWKHYGFKLPGGFDARCTGLKEADGVLVPLDDVRCGEIPEPAHDTTPDDDVHQRCRDYAAATPAVAAGVDLLRTGGFDPMLNVIPDGLGFAAIYYSQELSTLKGVHAPLRPALFVGKNFESVPVVTFVDMEVLSYIESPGAGPSVVVRFLSDPCSYDKDGNPVFVQPVGCKEGLPRKGTIKRLRRLPTPKDPKKPKPADDSEPVFVA